MNYFRSLVFGFTLPLRAAWTILRSPTLMFWSLLPILTTLILYTVVIGHLQGWISELAKHQIHSWGWNESDWMAAGALILVRILLLFVGAITFSFTASIAASPFNDILAERTEPRASPPLPPVPKSPWSAKIRLVFIDVLKTVAATLASLSALLFSWVPILNLLIFTMTFLLICFQFTSYPQTRRGEGLGAGLRFLGRHFCACVAFGFALSILFAIPIVASITLPLAVVGGTLLVARARGAPGLIPLK